MSRWKTISLFSDYMISDDGRVKSKQREILRISKYGRLFNKTINERILKSHLSGSGYLFVCLRKNNTDFNCRIHNMVSEAFIGPKPTGLIVLHKDHDKFNNNWWNLEYGTMAKNTQDYYKSIGKRTGFVPISDIPDIISRINNGEKIIDIANEYKVRRNDIAVLNKIITLTGEELTVNLTENQNIKI